MVYSIIDIFLGISFFVTFILSFILLFKSRDISGKFLSFASFSGSFWILISTIFRHTSGPMLLPVAKIQYFTGFLIMTNFVFFAYTFYGPALKKNQKLTTGILMLFFLFSYATLATDVIIKDAFNSNGMNIMSYGKYYWLYAAYITFLAVLSYYYLIKKSLTTRDSFAKLQLSQICIATGVSVIAGFIADIILPFWGIFNFLWVGPMTTTFFVIFSFYIIIRHHLFNIKVVAAEIFTFAILATVFTQILMSENSEDIIMRMILFIFITILSFFLLHGVHKEIKQKEEIENLAQRLSDFVSFTTHELRAPVGKFKWVLSMILDGNFGKLPSEAEKYIKKCLTSARDMGQNIETFLSFNKLSVNKLQLTKQEIDLQELVWENVNEFLEKAGGKNITIDFNKIPEPFPVYADRLQITNVINNLLSNAIKYTPEGGFIKINIDKKDNEQNIVFSVKDSGAGIEKNTMPLLFNEYERGNKEKTFSEGSGIGLFLSKKLIEMHGGQIWAESDGEDRGSKFSFNLPALKQ